MITRNSLYNIIACSDLTVQKKISLTNLYKDMSYISSILNNRNGDNNETQAHNRYQVSINKFKIPIEE